MPYGPLLQVRTFGKPRLADVTRAELHADPRPGGFRRFRHRVLPGALTAAAHDQQIAVADVVTPRYRPAAHGPQQKRGPGGPSEGPPTGWPPARPPPTRRPARPTLPLHPHTPP